MNKNKTIKSTSYLREVFIQYKKKKVEDGSPVGKSIRGAKQVVELFSDLQNEGKEKLISISLDSSLKIICFEVVAIGSINSIYARPAEATRASIMVNAYGVILVHNHPSGDVKPSKEDKKFTSDMSKILKLLGIEFHDHIIIGEEDYFSFAEKGLLGK